MDARRSRLRSAVEGCRTPPAPAIGSTEAASWCPATHRPHPPGGVVSPMKLWRVRVTVADSWELLVPAKSKAMATKKAKAAVRATLPSEEPDLRVEHLRSVT